MIVKRQREFTFADQKTIKEIKKVLIGDHKIGDLDNAKDAVVLGKLMRKTADSLDSKKTNEIEISDKEKEILKKIGMPETAENLKHFLDKYNNQEALQRWGRIYGKKIDKVLKENYDKEKPKRSDIEKNQIKHLREERKQIKPLKLKIKQLKNEMDNLDLDWDSYRKLSTQKFKARVKLIEAKYNKRFRIERLPNTYNTDIPKLGNLKFLPKILKDYPYFSKKDPETANKIKERARKSGITVENDSSITGGIYSLSNNSISLGKDGKDNPEIVGHELGHAKDFRLNKDSEAANRGFIIATLTRPDQPRKLNSRDAMNNIKSQFANGLRVGAEETMASYHGNSIVNQEGGKPDAKYLKKCGSTYAYSLGQDLTPMLDEIDRRKAKVKRINHSIFNKIKNKFKK